MPAVVYPLMFEQVSAEPPLSRLRSVGRVLPRVGLAVFFVLVGYSKFDSDPRSVWVQIFERIGVGQWLRYVTGVMYVGGAILLLPRPRSWISSSCRHRS